MLQPLEKFSLILMTWQAFSYKLDKPPTILFRWAKHVLFHFLLFSSSFFNINFQIILEEYILTIALRYLFADMTMVRLLKATPGK